MTIVSTEIAIIGAGPFGLSLAAHLRARGADYRIFGHPMKFWQELPAGINLKSFAYASSLSVPRQGVSYPEWCRRHGLEDHEPCSMQSFAEYGSWMQEQFVPDVERVDVVGVRRAEGGFALTLADGRQVDARKVVVATGLTHLAQVPECFRSLPPDLARHTYFISDYSRYRGKRVAVIGGGSSAVEAGALVREAGGEAQVLVRDKKVTFHARTPRQRPLLDRLREPESVLGAGLRNWIITTFPLLAWLLPDARRARMLRGYLMPSSPWWIKDRVVGKVPLELDSEVISARADGAGVRLDIRQAGSVREIAVDEVIVGTGFDFDIDRLAFLDPELRMSVRRTLKGPRLSLWFESSVPGLHFIGPMSSASFGPQFRFVSAAAFTARMVTWRLGRLMPQAEPAKDMAGVPKLGAT